MESKIIVQGKKVDLENFSDEQIVDLFKDLSKKELKIDEKIMMLEKTIAKMEESM